MEDSFLVASTSLIIGSSVAIGLLSILIFKMPSSTKKARRWSFTSKAMALGGFPPEANIPDVVINAAIFFDDDPPSAGRLVDEVVPKMLTFARFSGVLDPKTNTTKPIVGIDPKDLVRTIEIQGSQQATYDMIQEHLHDSLSHRGDTLPWWELLVIKNSGFGQSSVVWRVHHSIGDGLAMIGVVEEILEFADGSPMTEILPSSMGNKFKHKHNIFVLIWKCIVAFFKVLALPSGPYDTDTAFSPKNKSTMKHSNHRDLIILPTVPLDFVKDIKNAAKVTLNDVIYAVLSHAIHDYLKKEDGSVPPDLKCRTLMPIAFPRPKSVMEDRSETLRNKWCFLEADMGVQFSTLRERLEFIHIHLQEKKTSMVAPVQLAVQNTLPPLLPMSVNRDVVFQSMSRRSLIFSNVPGPSKPCLLAGKEAQGVQMFFSNLVTQTGFLSYRGKLFGNLCLDGDAIPNAQSFTAHYGAAFRALAKEFKVEVPAELSP